MRTLAILLTATALATTLSGCGGGDAQVASAGSTATPAPGAGTTPTTDAYAQFVTPTVAKSYSGVGGSEVFSYSTDARTPTGGTTGLTGFQGQQASVYAGNASTVRDSKITIAYDPRDAIFTLKVTDPRSGAAASTRFQDPGSRTNFGGLVEPHWGTDDFSKYSGVGRNDNIRFLQAGDGDPLAPYDRSGSGLIVPGNNKTPVDGTTGSSYVSTDFFYEVPGTTTKYVTLAGYIRNSFSWTDLAVGTGTAATTVAQQTWKLERGAFAYGVSTDNNSVPKTGSGTYAGTMLATMVFNPTIDGATARDPITGATLPSYFQWISGTSTTTVNFATGGVTLGLNGIVGDGQFDRYTTQRKVTVTPGTTFTAAGTATVNLINTGGYTGQFQTAIFGSTTNGANPNVAIAGSSIDGAFYGPAAEETGGGFRIVGGTPDQRIDIVGAFKGKK